MSAAAAAPNRLLWSGAAAKSDKGAEPDAPVTRALRRFGRRYPAVGRAAVGVLCALASPFAMPPRGAGLTVAVAAAVVAWNLLYLWIAAARRALLAPVPGHIRRRRCVGLRSLPGQAGAGRPGTAGRLARVDLPDRVVHGRCDSVPGGRACRGRRDVGGVRHVRRRNRGVAGAHGVGRRVSRWRGLDAGGGRPRPVPLGAAAARGPRGGPPDAGAVRRGARRCDRRRSPCGPARALGHRARHLGEHAAHDRSGCCARHRGMAARPGAARHRPAGRRARRAAGRGRRRGRAGTRAGRRGLRGARARGGRLPGGGGGAARGRPGPGRGRGRGPGERRAARGRRVCARGRAAGRDGVSRSSSPTTALGSVPTGSVRTGSAWRSRCTTGWRPRVGARRSSRRRGAARWYGCGGPHDPHGTRCNGSQRSRADSGAALPGARPAAQPARGPVGDRPRDPARPGAAARRRRPVALPAGVDRPGVVSGPVRRRRHGLDPGRAPPDVGERAVAGGRGRVRAVGVGDRAAAPGGARRPPAPDAGRDRLVRRPAVRRLRHRRPAGLPRRARRADPGPARARGPARPAHPRRPRRRRRHNRRLPGGRRRRGRSPGPGGRRGHRGRAPAGGDRHRGGGRPAVARRPRGAVRPVARQRPAAPARGGRRKPLARRPRCAAPRRARGGAAAAAVRGGERRARPARGRARVAGRRRRATRDRGAVLRDGATTRPPARGLPGAGRRRRSRAAGGPPLGPPDAERHGDGGARRCRRRRRCHRRGDRGARPVRSQITGEITAGEVSTVVVGAEQQTWVEARWTPSAS